MILIFWGLAQTDLVVAQFVRAVHLPWLETIGNLGNDLGDGWTLVGLSALLLALGLAWPHAALRDAGLQSLIAHAVAGLVAQTLKRAAGRPRPRLTHDDAFQFAPAFQSGFESFPSGHATASFAVATVLARHFPRAAWALYAIAAYIACSRVVRGSHFPTDVAVGALLGLVIGLLVCVPWGGKGRAVSRGVVGFTLALSALFAPIWLALHQPEAGVLGKAPAVFGIVLVAAGAALRFRRIVLPGGGPSWLPGLPAAHATVAVGLGLSTGSGLLLAVAGLAALILWLDAAPSPVPARPDGPVGSPVPAALVEVARLSTLVLAAFLLHAVKGLLPLL